MRIKSKEKISFDEFKAWVNGLLYGKGRTVPDADDWKEIKNMMEKVVPDVVEMQDTETPFFPTLPQAPIVAYTTPHTPKPWWKTQPTCEHNNNSNDMTPYREGIYSVPIKGSYGGFSGFGISAGYENHIKEGDELTGQMIIGSLDDSFYGLSNMAAPSGTILPCPNVFVEQEGTTEESLTALEKARVSLKEITKDAE